ncbi:cytoplasmic dynein 2 intermediate chain 1 isoform X4 [Mauremys reevesii]|uniref:cytoplasmic dynein 2 intermediate chain 1 isoform X4 n=1 Tax=Mauremys reevesii TaxID=260615 RepID=UPI00193ED3D6|nr:cytoplasmic dynein 2 intermediate chain 1 isoform X4 [Mauremys reevesii]
MEPEKRRTKEDTWKSDELKKHLRVSQSDSQSEDKKQKEKKLQRERETHDIVDYKGYIQKDQDKDRGKAKERTGERERFKSSERDRDKLRDRERGKDHHREREREKLKEKDQEKDAEKEKHITRKDKEKASDKERDRKYRRDDLKQMLIQNNLKASGGRDKEQRRRRESKDQFEQANVRDDVKERRHTERKVKEGKKSESKNSLGEFLTKKDEEGGHRHKSHRDQELNKDRGRSHSDKREHSVRGGKARPSKEGSHELFVKDGEEKYASRRPKEGSSIEDRERQLSENNEKRQREENEGKKRDLKNSEHKKQGKSLREEEETSLQHERNARDKGKSIEREKKEDTSQRPHQGEHVSAWKPMQRQKSEEELEISDNYLTNYEDDFEDYEDDFDDDDDEDNDSEARVSEERLREIPVSKKSEIEEIQRAINAENERIGTLLPKQIQKECEKEPNVDRTERQDSPARGSLCGMFMDFETANQRQSSQIMASKQKKRSTELLRLIDLDFSVSFSLLDLPPVNEYDMYIRNFGKTNTKQAYVQSNEDNLERDVQTDEIETLEKWTQHPGDSVLVSGGPRSSNDVSTDIVVTPKIDSQRLTNFLRSACQVIAVLLEEDRVATQPRWNLRSRQTSLSISDSCFQLNTNLPFLHGRKVSCLHVSQVQRQALLSVHGLPEKPGANQLDRKYIVCVWNVWQPSSPQKVLVCEAEVSCCCFSPNKATLVFAGTMDGSLVVWDLREDSRMHHCMKLNETDWIFRSPTFSTDGVLSSLNHTYPVLAIEPVSTSVCKEHNYGLSHLSSQEEMSGLSFQIASMDENGTLNLWVAVELQKVDLAGSQSDLGLIPGGKVKLVHSSTVQLNSSLFPKDILCLRKPQTLNIKFLPSNPNHFIVGTDIGVVGCSDGSIRLHQMTSEHPLIQWNDSTNGQPVIALQWALTRPAVFFVLDASSTVYIWDLLENDLCPVAKQIIQSDKVMTMVVLGEPEKTNGLLGIALAKQSGIIDIQYVKKSSWNPERLKKCWSATLVREIIDTAVSWSVIYSHLSSYVLISHHGEIGKHKVFYCPDPSLDFSLPFENKIALTM